MTNKTRHGNTDNAAIGLTLDVFKYGIAHFKNAQGLFRRAYLKVSVVKRR